MNDTSPRRSSTDDSPDPPEGPGQLRLVLPAEPRAGSKWSVAELRVLDRYPKIGIGVSSLLPNRTKGAIYTKVQELGIQRAGRGAHGSPPLDGADVCNGLGITALTLTSWIRTRGLRATMRQDGWKIQRAALCRWIAAHPSLISLSKVNKIWFIGLAFPAPRRAR